MSKKKKVFIAGMIIVPLIAAGLLIKLFQWGDEVNREVILGNNINVSYYSYGILEYGYKSIAEGLEDMSDDIENKIVIGEKKSGNLTIIYMQEGSYVDGYEFAKKGEKYYYIGVRGSDFDPIIQHKDYGFLTTVRVDVSNSCVKFYRKTLKHYHIDTLPVWGISDSKEIYDVIIEDQSIDDIIKMQNEGKEYYLWYIEDLKTQKDIQDIIIE